MKHIATFNLGLRGNIIVEEKLFRTDDNRILSSVIYPIISQHTYANLEEYLNMCHMPSPYKAYNCIEWCGNC